MSTILLALLTASLVGLSVRSPRFFSELEFAFVQSAGLDSGTGSPNDGSVMILM